MKYSYQQTPICLRRKKALRSQNLQQQKDTNQQNTPTDRKKNSKYITATYMYKCNKHSKY